MKEAETLMREIQPLNRERAPDGEIVMRAVAAGEERFFSALPDGIPTERQIEDASALAAQAAAQTLLPTLLDRLGGGDLTEEQRAVLTLRVEDALPTPALPAPTLEEHIPPLRVALLSGLGSLAGMAILSPLTAMLLGSREVGLLTGAPLGALVLTLGAFYLPKHPWVLRGLMVLLGLGTIREVIGFLGGNLLLSRGWAFLGRRRSSLARILLYPALVALLAIAGRRTVRYDEKQYWESVRHALTVWAEGAARTVALAIRSPGVPMIQEEASELPELASRVLAMQDLTSDDLAPAMEELAQHVQNLGFRQETTDDTVVWEEAMADRYTPFGLVEPGDRVTVEREPVLRGKTVVSKGIVRKVRS